MSNASDRARNRQRGQPANPGQFAKEAAAQAETAPAHDVDLDGSVDSEVYLPRFPLPKRLGTKAADTVGHSVLEPIYCYGLEWDRWSEENPEQARGVQPPFTQEVLELVALTSRGLPRRARKRLAKAWDEHKDDLTCAGDCWTTSTARQAFDNAVAEVFGIPKRRMAEAVAQVVAARSLVEQIRGEEPGTASGCHAPDNCPGGTEG